MVRKEAAAAVKVHRLALVRVVGAVAGVLAFAVLGTLAAKKRGA